MTKPGIEVETKRATEEAGSSVESMGTTVDERLSYTADFFIRVLNHRFQKDLTNQKARADVIVNGQCLAEKVPATFLLELESRLVSYRAMYAAIPTLDIKKSWEKAADLGTSIYKAKNPEVRAKTEKDFKSRIIVAATDKHPAQIEKWQDDVVVGKITITEHSGMWTSARKAQVLARCDVLIAAVKEARSRANQVQTEAGYDIGKAMLDFIEAKEINAG